MDKASEQPDRRALTPRDGSTMASLSDEGRGTLHHDLGNKLTIIKMGTSSLLRRKLIDPEGLETGTAVLEAAEAALRLFWEIQKGRAKQ